MASDNKTLKVLKRIMDIPETLKEFIEGNYNLLVDDLNLSLARLSLARNFESSTITDLEIEAGATGRANHKLGVVPTHRIITRQIGGGLITDGTFTKNYIELINTGVSKVRLTVVLLKE